MYEKTVAYAIIVKTWDTYPRLTESSSVLYLVRVEPLPGQI